MIDISVSSKLLLLYVSGCWCLPYLTYFSYPLTSFSLSKAVGTEEIKERLSTSGRENLIERHDARSIEEENNFKAFANELNDRVDKLEGRTTEQTERLLNIARMLEKLKESDLDIWSQYNNKIMVLEKKLREDEEENKKSSDTSTHRIDTIKLEFETLKGLYSQLKSCCNSHLETPTSQDMEERVERILVQYFGTISKEDLTKVIQKLTIVDNTEDSIMTSQRDDRVSSGDMTEKRVHEIVREALKTYDADKTGRVDYALEPAGGQVISTRCTQKYDTKSRAFKILTFTLYHENNNPRTVIQGNPIQPGACWAFQGFPGYILIKLRSFIYVTGFTVEHAPKSILPNGEMKSAPRKFNVWGFIDENDPEPVLFGDYEFLASDDNLQYFPIKNTTISMPYEFVELRVHSNHGELEYTCLYRFRVHGKPA